MVEEEEVVGEEDEGEGSRVVRLGAGECAWSVGGGEGRFMRQVQRGRDESE